ncbi:C40 family peptidase [Virgibacillus salexigens]|uniref:C40 family peptidase n=1 Tax=Virgibacillus salexigens TaxID=61016 RepID=UPI001F245ECF|nr:NlpC/P60 family protein [Virgibacillus salexigens]
MNQTVEHMAKRSLLYGYVLSQPLVNYVDAHPELQNKLLFESDQLEFGKHGEAVRHMQQKLHTLSYFDKEIDGRFGVLTEQAIKNFQAEHNLTINGKVNNDTLRTMVKDEKKAYKEQLENFSDEIEPGMYNAKVKIVQKALQYFGYYEGELDGIYGPLTKKALEIAEEEHHMELIDDHQQAVSPAPTEQTKSEQVKAKAKDTSPASVKKQPNKDVESNEVKKVTVQGNNAASIVEEARAQLGTPYKWGGEDPGGFDCSGFIQHVFTEQGIQIPRTVNEIWNFSSPISDPSIGDFVFFETYKPGPSHMGIYVGDGKFIHAGESRGVEISKLTNPYWEERYIGAKRVMQQ